MSSIDSPQAPRAFVEQGQSIRLAQRLSSPWLTLGLLLIAIAQQIAGHLDCDVSWFITFAEKYLDGAIPYVDVTDPNPPLAFLSLAPPVAVARALDVAVEPVVAAFVFCFAGASIALCALIFRYGPRRSREDWSLLLNAAIFLLLVAPAIVFAEREHLSLLALAPMLALLSVSVEGGRPPGWIRTLAGLGAAVAVCFKPFFALAYVAPALALAAREHSLRPFFNLEMAIAAAFCAAYGVVTLTFFPAYVDYALPVIADVYQPARHALLDLALLSLAPVNIALLFALGAVAAQGIALPPVAPGFVGPAPARVCAFASVGFLISFIAQGKGWSNHAYPGIALALLAWTFFLLDKHPRAQAARNGRLFKFIFLPAFIAAPALFGAVKLLGDIPEHTGLREEIARVAPARPRVIAMARQLDFGHPVTRQLAGVWVGRPNALWTASLAAYLLREEKDPARRARLEGYRRRDLAGFVEDVRAGRPDVIVVEDKDTREWLLKQPETAGALVGFEKAGQADDVEIWRRVAD